MNHGLYSPSAFREQITGQATPSTFPVHVHESWVDRIALSTARWLQAIAVAATCLMLCIGLAQAQETPVRAGSATSAEHRVALVIGNAAYGQGSLANPVNDARAMASRLRTLGFDVILRENLKTRDIGGVYREFRSKIAPGNVALVFYAGHGIQFKGQNYFPAVDSVISSEEDVPLQSLNLSSLLDNMEEAKAGVSLVFLDACRNNPYSRSFRSPSNGLAKVEAASGTLIHYATKPGSVAADGDGKNGTYTEALLAQMSEPGVPVELMLKRVSNRVVAKTKGKQEPWVEGSLRGDFYFFGPTTVQVQGGAPELTAAQQEEKFWDDTKAVGNKEAFDAYLDSYPKGRYANLARANLARWSATSAAPQASLSTGKVFKDCADCPEMVILPAGSFAMGSNAQEQAQANSAGLTKTYTDREYPKHNVSIRSFALGKTEVTRRQFAAFVAASGHNAGNSCWTFTGGKWVDSPGHHWRNPGFAQTDNDPVTCVNWDDAKAYVDWLTQKTGYTYRLPSEAEWEYACRAGANHTYCGSDDVNSVAVYGRKSGDKTLAVGGKQANAWGLFDMSGNALEWTQDCWNETYRGAPSDGSAWTTGACGLRVLRGGSWYFVSSFARAALRDKFVTAYRDFNLGFRLARALP